MAKKAVGGATTHGRNRLSRNDPMLAGHVELGNTADNGATIDYTDDAIIQATMNTERNPGARAWADLGRTNMEEPLLDKP